LGRLLSLVTADLPGHRVEVAEPGGARFVPIGGGPVLWVGTRVEKRFLGRTEIAVFQTHFPNPSGVPAELEVRHTGGRTRTGVEIRGRGSGGDYLQSALADDHGFADAALPLDFKRFDLVSDAETLTATIELMGASYVTIAFPPMRSYVRLYPDQREALVATFGELERVASQLEKG
jgi:hypothetical protein